jgi:hypothetical protein
MRSTTLGDLSMSTRQPFIALALACFATLACAADPPAIVGRLDYLAGPVSFAPGDASSEWSAAVLNRPFTSGDRLWTDYGGRAEWHIGSTAIRLATRTSLDALNIDESRVQLSLATGSVNLRVRSVPPSGTFEIDTPQGAVILTEPGSYRIAVDAAGTATTVVVRAGRVDVLTPVERFSVGPNQRGVIVATDGPSYDISSVPPFDEFDRWCADRDRSEDNVAAAQYLPPGMTGYEDLDRYGSWQVVPEYGALWVPANVPADWAPYRYGHWVWISPWGWTWVDDAPWGFAPFHYGRWIWHGQHWAWAPGHVAARPVYAPALVAFIGGSGFTVSIQATSVPAVAWVPLGWREPFVPWYRATPAYVRDVNVPYVANINVTNINVANIRHANRAAPSGVTVVPREQFVAARRVEPLPVSQPALSAAPASSAAPVARPQSSSFAMSRAGGRPPTAAVTREVVGVHAPPIRTEATMPGDAGAASAFAAERRPVRVIGTQPPGSGAARARAGTELGEREGSGTRQRAQSATPAPPPAQPQVRAPALPSEAPARPAARSEPHRVALPVPSPNPGTGNAPAVSPPVGTAVPRAQSSASSERATRPQGSASAVPHVETTRPAQPPVPLQSPSQFVRPVPPATSSMPAPAAPHVAPGTPRQEGRIRREGPPERGHVEPPQTLPQQAAPQTPQQAPPQQAPHPERRSETAPSRGRGEREHGS